MLKIGTWVKIKPECKRFLYKDHSLSGFICNNYRNEYSVMVKYNPPLRPYQTFDHKLHIWGSVSWLKESELEVIEPLQESFSIDEVLGMIG